MGKKTIRDSIRLTSALIFFWIYIPHLLVYLFSKNRRVAINSDLRLYKEQMNIAMPLCVELLYLLHNNSWFRCIFYRRIGATLDMLIGWWRPGCNSLIIPFSTKIGKGMLTAHCYATVLNAESIGDNFHFLHCTTIGKKNGKRPRIGDNVYLGANVVIIGDINIGNNVTVGAGSVVVKDVPDNAIVAGNPARVIKYNDTIDTRR